MVSRQSDTDSQELVASREHSFQLGSGHFSWPGLAACQGGGAARLFAPCKGQQWLVLVFIMPLAAVLPTAGLCWLVAGGLFYTKGAVIYLSDKFPYSHTVWHLFVLSGTVSHFIAVLCYVIPVPVPS